MILHAHWKKTLQKRGGRKVFERPLTGHSIKVAFLQLCSSQIILDWGHSKIRNRCRFCINLQKFLFSPQIPCYCFTKRSLYKTFISFFSMCKVNFHFWPPHDKSWAIANNLKLTLQTRFRKVGILDEACPLLYGTISNYLLRLPQKAGHGGPGIFLCASISGRAFRVQKTKRQDVRSVGPMFIVLGSSGCMPRGP